MAEFEQTAPGEHSLLEEAVEGRVENLVFNYRGIWLLFILAVSLFLGYHALQIKPETGFRKMIPQDHEYITNYNKHSEYVASANVVRILVEAKGGNIFAADYLQQLQQLSDEIFFLPGVDRAALKSLWTKNVQWRAVTEEGFTGGVVIGDDYDGEAESLEGVRRNGSPDFCFEYLTGILGTPLEVRRIEPLSLLTQTEETIASPLQSIMVLVKSWEPPLAELSDYLCALPEAMQRFILPLDWDEGKVQPIREIHLDEWRRFCGTLAGWQLLQLADST